nr:glycosyltransferase family 4 protein [Candidatus Eremiobacteraeota bacterium]
MPVLVTTEFPPPGYGGIERYMSRLASEISAAGHPLAVVAPQMPDDAAFDRDLPYPVVRFRFPGYDRPEPAPVWIARVAQATIQAQRLIPDKCSIASSWVRSGIACALLPRAVRGNLAIIAHGSEILTQRSGPRRALMQWTFGRAHAAVANSTFTARLLKEAGCSEEPVLARCGVDPVTIPPAPAAVPTILSVGRLVKRKGFDRTIQALPPLIEKFPELRYEIIGVGPDDAYFREQAAQQGVASHVFFLGDVDDAEVRAAYARAWCFALPTRRVGVGDVEGFGIVYLEAAMASLPAVGGRNSGAE